MELDAITCPRAPLHYRAKGYELARSQGALVTEVLAMRYCPLRLTIILFFPQALALVVLLLSFSNSNFDFCIAIKKVEPQGNQGVAACSNAMSELLYLFFVEQEFAFTPRGVISPRSLVVFGNMDGF
ncbi:MAG: hypothetical protein ABR66_02435 [Microbacteriaceae bacterium BACL25 MAG-120322-bin65]|nr:MAG: hypothetical protein ABR66_02435 [Microbacteriaceae bacterium BACL25 MAG-120322-bin65]